MTQNRTPTIDIDNKTTKIPHAPPPNIPPLNSVIEFWTVTLARVSDEVPVVKKQPPSVSATFESSKALVIVTDAVCAEKKETSEYRFRRRVVIFKGHTTTTG